MLCIFCCQERAPSCEHVLPLAIGGTIMIDRVCEECNSALGSRVDAALSDFFPIRVRRGKLGLAGNKGESPAWYEMFLGQAKLVGETADRVQITFSEATGRLDTRQLYHAEDVVAPDGKKVREITLDARDKNQIPTIIARERKRHGVPPLSEKELAAAAANYTTRAVNNPVVQRSISVSFAYLRHAMIKVAYELAFLWLGESYLVDPVAVDLRTAICDPDIASTDNIAGYVGDAENCEVFKFWVPDEAHHLAYGSVLPGKGIAVSVRVFDIYAAGIVVSKVPGRYLTNVADQAKLRFLAIDAVSGRTIDTPFAEESRRLAAAMTAYGRLPPFPDPLTPLAD
ncbi:MAG: HNH endonuclease [Rhodospirillales bacterium]|nr:HNH endonuclease [Rhodospirillales bacterium]